MTAVARDPRPKGLVAVAGALVVAAVAVGACTRWWLATHTIGTLTSDGAVIGLMALHLLHHGQLPAYMWGQSYGGSLEMLGTAAVFAVAGPSTGALLATTAASTAVAVFGMWRAARRLVGEPAAAVGALAMWVGSALLAWRSVKPGGSYLVGLALAWFAILWLARLREGERTHRAAWCCGLLVGLALWTSPMTLQLLLPAVLWGLPTLRRLGRRLVDLVAATVVGLAPAIAFGLTHHFSNLQTPGGGHVWDGFVPRVGQFFEFELPIAASLRVEGTLRWALGPIGVALYALALAGLLAVTVAVVRGRAPRCALAVLTLALLPILFAANVLADHVGQGRYVELGSTMGFVLLGVGLERAARAVSGWRPLRRRSAAWVRLGVLAVGVALLGALGASALRAEPQGKLVEFTVGGVPMPPRDGALLQALAAHHVRDAFSGYWLAYRVMFETGEQTAVTPYSPGRYPPIREQVRSSPHPAYLFVATSRSWGEFVAWCARHRVAARVWHAGQFVVVQPAVRVLPGELAGVRL